MRKLLLSHYTVQCDWGYTYLVEETDVASFFLINAGGETICTFFKCHCKRRTSVVASTKLACEDRDCPVCKVDRDDLGGNFFLQSYLDQTYEA